MQTVEAAGLPIGEGFPPRIMGIVNLSEESPYDPSVFTDPSAAAAYVDSVLIQAGADIVDVGLESANKRFDVLTAEEELERLDRAIAMISAVEGTAVFSIETRYASVADAALSAGFDMVNDICGFADPEMVEVCDRHEAVAVKMAGPGNLEAPGALTTVDAIYDALASEPLPERTIIDPAFGGWCEGKTVDVDRETFQRLREFRAINRPMLVSINRKNFLRHLAERSTDDALPVSLAATALAVERGAHVIRTHDVAATCDAAIIGHHFSANRLRDPERSVYELDINTPSDLRRHLERIDAGSAVAADLRAKAFELRSLTDVDRQLLRHLTTDRGGTFAEGTASGPAILVVSPRDVDRLRDAVKGESHTLAEMLETIDALMNGDPRG